MTTRSGLFDVEFLAAAMMTAHVSRWTVFKARLFGERRVPSGPDGTVVAYKWRGRLYMTHYDPTPTVSVNEQLGQEMKK